MRFSRGILELEIYFKTPLLVFGVLYKLYLRHVHRFVKSTNVKVIKRCFNIFHLYYYEDMEIRVTRR